MKTSIIILTYNKLDYTKECIESIREYTEKSRYELIVVDNASSDATVDWLKKQSDIKTVFNEENVGFPKGCNQGIEVATGDNILLLNNDIVVTKNWLTNLLTCLYSSKKIGAVGPVTNSAAYYSTIPFNYNNMEEMNQFAVQYNESNQNKWEERLKLIGFCMLIKREVIDKIGLLDERFSPGNFEDDDYSIRIRQAGYKLMICKDTFIHHYGSVSWKEDVMSYARILSDNELKFKEKWGTDSSSYFIHNGLINQMTISKNETFNILHIGCSSGATLLKIKSCFNNAVLYGVEKNFFEAKEAEQIGRIFKNVNEIENIRFDVILYTDHNSFLEEKNVVEISSLLKENGTFLGEFLNIGNYLYLQHLVVGDQPFKKNHYFYSLNEINNLFQKIKDTMNSQITCITNGVEENSKKFINQLESMYGNYGNNTRIILESASFIVKARKRNSQLKKLLQEIENKEAINDELLILNEADYEEVIQYIVNKSNNPSEVLQKIALNNFYLENHEHVLPYLQAAHEYDLSNRDTVYNLGYILCVYGEKELALRYIKPMKEKDEKITELYNMINKVNHNKTRELTFLLRRIEFDLDIDKSRAELSERLISSYFEEDEIFDVIAKAINDKVKVLQVIAVTNFEKSHHEYVLPFLNVAYELDNNNTATLYNLAYILAAYDEKETAYNFLEKIPQQERTQHIIDLFHFIQGENVYE